MMKLKAVISHLLFISAGLLQANQLVVQKSTTKIDIDSQIGIGCKKGPPGNTVDLANLIKKLNQSVGYKINYL